MVEAPAKRPRVLLKSNQTAPQPPPPPLEDKWKKRAKPTDFRQIVIFDVGGQIFKAPFSMISKNGPSTLLAQLVNSAPAPLEGEDEPIFVDGAAERFSCILDWYRYGEIHVPRNVAVASVLADAQYYGLPEEIRINGVVRSTKLALGPKVAQEVLDNIIKHWPGFDGFLASLLTTIRSHFHTVGTSSGTGSQEDQAYDFQPFVFPIYEDGDKGWLDKQNVCSASRARLVAYKLEDRGYICSFSDSELIVSLPLSLKGELAADAGLEDAPGASEEG